MKFLDRFSIKGRLFATLGLVLAMLGGIVAISTWSSHASLAALRSIVNGELVKFQLVAAVDSSTKGNSRNVLELFAVSSLEQQKSIRKRMGDTRKNIDDLLLQLDGLISEPRGRELFNAVVQRRIQFVQSFSTASELLTQGKGEEARSLLFSGVLPAIDALQTPISALLEYQKALANQTAKQTEIAMEREAILIVVLGLIALALGVGSALLLIRAIVRPLELAKAVATQIGKGNLAIQFDIEGKNELSDMLMALHFMQDALAHVIMRLQENATSVALSSEEIAKANIDLSARTESQASSLEETAAAMEEMTASVQQNAKATKLANDLADEASTNAQEVGELVGQMVETMRDIHTSSQRINDIVGVIDSIAFQTNILALNAAVEAARAGEQGRGFAVVASEVRSLAQRSASAAQEIKVIISQNTEKMELGNSRAIKAGESVRQAVVVIRNVTQTVSNVALATREQAQGIAQVGQAVAQLDEVTQQNAALVEETAAATQSLNEQVQALKGTINRFQIGQRATPSFA